MDKIEINHVIRKHYPRVESTMLTSVPFSKDTCYIITADEQTDGFGASGHYWYSPPGNIFVTYIFSIYDSDENNVKPWKLTIEQVAGLAVAESLEQLGISTRIKWKNDILVANKKISGILVRRFNTEVNNNYLLYIGIGVNVNMSEIELREVDQPAISVAMELKKEYDKSIIEKNISAKIIEYMTQLSSNGFSSFCKIIDEKLLWKNKNIRVDLTPRYKRRTERSSSIFGQLIGINEKGELMVQTKKAIRSVEYGSLILLDK